MVELIKPLNNVAIQVLIEDTVGTNTLNLKAKHGLSILLSLSRNRRTYRVLMDTGPDFDSLKKNMRELGIRSDKLDLVFLSHGHYDHTLGLTGILRQLKKNVPVIFHPDVIAQKFAYKPSLTYIGSGIDLANIMEAGGVPLVTSSPVKMMEGAYTSGEVLRNSEFEFIEGFWTVKDGIFQKDKILDDQAIYIFIKGKGLVIVTGCAHSGVVNIIEQAKKQFPKRKVHAVIGGFHLEKANEKRLKYTVEALSRIENVYPCHCTGNRAIRALEKSIGERCKRIRTGSYIEIE